MNCLLGCVTSSGSEAEITVIEPPAEAQSVARNLFDSVNLVSPPKESSSSVPPPGSKPPFAKPSTSKVPSAAVSSASHASGSSSSDHNMEF